VSLDCDGDALLVRVDQVGPPATPGSTVASTPISSTSWWGCARDHRQPGPGRGAGAGPQPGLDLAGAAGLPGAGGRSPGDPGGPPVPGRRRDPIGVYRKLADNQPGTFLLESAEHGGVWSRWSIIGAASRATLTARDGAAHWIGDPPVGVPTGGDPLAALRDTVDVLRAPGCPACPR
jgi:hypothetical protein